MKITVHFLIIERDPAATGEFEFRERSVLRNVFKIENGSFPQSYTTEGNSLEIKFKYKRPSNKICKHLPSCIRFLLQITSSTGNS